MPVMCSLKIESADTLSIELPDRNQSLETDLEITFPDYDVTAPPQASGFLASVIENPSSFGLAQCQLLCERSGACTQHCGGCW